MKFKSLIICLLILFSVVHTHECRNTGRIYPGIYPPTDGFAFQSVLTEYGANSMADLAIPIVEESLVALIIPDIDGDVDLGIASITYDISSIVLTEIDISNLVFKFDGESNRVVVSLTDGFLHLEYKWGYETTTYPYVADGGFGTAEFQASISLSAELEIDIECQSMQVILDPITFIPSQIDIILHGGASWLYDLIIDLLEDLIMDYLIDPFAQLIQQTAQEQLDQWIQKGALVVQQPGSGQVTCFDRRPAASPIVQDGVISIPYIGKVVLCDGGEGEPWDVQPQEMPLVFSDSFVQYLFDAATFDSNHYQHYLQGEYQHTVTADDVPEEFRPFFTAGELAVIIPGLAEYAGLEITLDVYALEPPTDVVQPVALFTTFITAVDIMVDSQDTPLLQLQLDIGAAGTVVLSNITHSWGMDTCFSSEYELYNMTMTVSDTSVGPVGDEETLYQLTSLLAEQMLMPWATDHSSRKELICMETDFATTMTPSVLFHDTYMVLEFDQI
eukprot:gnl/Dysnectes_brevis/1943_a2233_1597.p1 GENE.gnl/Dysnectes_brevis/1943_a2233_1597~~gnl/Dysnectes_brevis/1943_a2233_1597.p1  ORF type:complete len:502 (-),score=137.13 gnl/Dysnectes_brevis/1943_a2233_1597:243-1748(-)